MICHNDLASWNTVFARERPVAFIDWDLAAPGPRWWDVCFPIWHFVPLYGDPATDPFSMAEFDPRARRTRLFCDAYGLGDRGELVDKIVERQRAGRRAIMQAADAGDPAYQRLRTWAPTQASSARSATCSHTAPPCKTPSPKRPGQAAKGPSQCSHLAAGMLAGKHHGTRPGTTNRSGRRPCATRPAASR